MPITSTGVAPGRQPRRAGGRGWPCYKSGYADIGRPGIRVFTISAWSGETTQHFWFDTAEGGWWFTLFTAILGSVILLWVVGMVQKKT
jgi:hypothetical protein